ncbi:hypothetical protein J7T55_010804 [Diaporthe amygdali]|uniref:uncharacterized protein n=1 Tax=Phomopsis amygdali TaxID=1214568 RepID=UPI0022FEC821|nr:uncharacterized protein J7T55_010804 [Diaporthe amygdali]KAJ0114415.1 hypothetical protein J7T55_010804 [Diaporthe amygdali]
MPPKGSRMSTGSAGPNVGVPRQSERTASENKERAYIAASRRGDRSLEARVQSAYAASEIHKQRTGKALKVSEQIVLNEEMYEEEDDLPARYSALLNNNDILASMPRFQAYAIATLGTRAAAYDRFPNLQRDLQREADVNAQFAEFFGPRGFSSRPAGGFQTNGPSAQQVQTSPQTTAAPFPPTTPSHQPAFHYPSPQNALASPVDSHVGSPATANPIISNSGFPSPSLQMSMHQRSMSMGNLDALQISANGHSRTSSISPVMAPQAAQMAGQRRSFGEAFPEAQSPSSTPPMPAAFRQVSGMPSPGMPAPMGTPHNQNIQRRASHSSPLSPGSLQPAYGTGFTSELPGNLRGMFPQDTDFAGFFSGGQSPAATRSNATQAPFQLQQHGDLRELRARKQSRGRNTQPTPGPKKESQAAVKNEKEQTPHAKLEKTAVSNVVKKETTVDDQTFSESDPLQLYTQSQPLGAVKLETADLPDNAATQVLPDCLEESNLDGNDFQQFYNTDDFTTDFFNATSNFDQFDFDSYLQMPASQSEVEN